MYWYMHWCVEFENENAFQMYKRLFYCTHTHTHTTNVNIVRSVRRFANTSADDRCRRCTIAIHGISRTPLYINSRFANGWHSGHSNAPIWFWSCSCRWHGMADARDGWLSSIVSTMFLIFAHSSKRSATHLIIIIIIKDVCLH